MTDVHGNQHSRRGRAFAIAVRALLAILLALAAGPAGAEDGKWSLQIEALIMDAFGHDQHVMTIHELSLDPVVDDKTAVTLDTDAGPAYRAELQYLDNQWGWGLDFFWFNTSQGRESRTGSAGGGVDQVAFEVADQIFTSFGPGDVVYFEVLEDTDFAAWTTDLYAIRTLAEKPESAIHLQFGVRVGDFDNDFRAVVGVEGAFGSFLDSSSNYGLMLGPIVGLAGEARRGRSRIKAYLGQSVLLGTAELSQMSRAFDGSPDEPAFTVVETFRKDQDTAIPITEFRVKWTYRITDRLSLGLGANASAWFDVPVPPGVIPGPGGDQVLHENTIVFFGTLAALELTF